MMDYELFKATVVKELPNYLSPEHRDVELRTRSMTKVNQTKDSLEFYQPDDKGKGGIAPTFYLDDLYEHYKECEDIRQVLHDTAGRYESAMMSMPNFYLEELNADFIRKNVIMTLVNTESNRDLLEKMPHREINDCSVMYRVVFTVEGEAC
ncbi:MAG: DUF5688 family protein [Eubacterium sp.]|nr:DUF5688 family protein [Eubacterium sp.]